MIKKLRRKFILTVMTVVTIILLAIFFTMLFTTQRSNERRSTGMLLQALNMPVFPGNRMPLSMDGPSPPAPGFGPDMRLPILVVEVDENGSINGVSNQLHFLEESDVLAIVRLLGNNQKNSGVLRDQQLRYLQMSMEDGVRIAFADISVEREMLRGLIINSLAIGGLAMVVFFLLSVVLAHWAVRPFEIAWEQQEQFIASASHELKTPLTVILSNAQMLHDKKILKDGKNSTRLEHIHVEAQRMKHLVEDMLTLARTGGSLRLEELAPVDFSYIVKNIVLMYESIVYDENKNLLFEVEEGLSVRGDQGQLQQLIHILLDNARKYSPPGGSIIVDLVRSDQRRLWLRVKNDGLPIPSDELEHVFLRFYRFDESRTGNGSFGLGLPIARNIVTSHKGNIWAESDEKEGNSFFVSLPLA